MGAREIDLSTSFRPYWLLPLALLLAGVAMSPLDLHVSTYFQGNRARWFSELLELCEVFGHGGGASLIVISTIVLGRLELRSWPWLIAGSLGSGVVANLLKLGISRTRPRDFDLLTGTVWQTFIRGAGATQSMQSMPSAHTATACGLAVVLTALYPRGGVLFSVLALLVGFQRIATQAHFPSDVCAGAAVGTFVGMACAKFLLVSGEHSRRA